MPTSITSPFSKLTPVQRRQQLAEILAHGVLRLARQEEVTATKFDKAGRFRYKS